MKTEVPTRKSGDFFLSKNFWRKVDSQFDWHRITRGTEDGLRNLIGTDGVDNCITYTTPANQNSGRPV